VFCQKCGNNLPDDSMFCQKCGAKITVEDEIQQPMETLTFDSSDSVESYLQPPSVTPVQRQNREPNPTTNLKRGRRSQSKSKTNWLYIVIPVIAIAIAAGVLYFLLSDRGSDDITPTPEEVIVTPTIEPEQPIDETEQSPPEILTDTQQSQEPEPLPPGTEPSRDISLHTVTGLEGWVSIDLPLTWHLNDIDEDGYTYAEIYNDDKSISLVLSDMAGGIDWRFENNSEYGQFSFNDGTNGYMFFLDNYVIEWVHEGLGIVLTLYDSESYLTYGYGDNAVIIQMIAESLTFG